MPRDRNWRALAPDPARVLEQALGTVIGGIVIAIGAQIIGAIHLSAEQIAALVGVLTSLLLFPAIIRITRTFAEAERRGRARTEAENSDRERG